METTLGSQRSCSPRWCGSSRDPRSLGGGGRVGVGCLGEARDDLEAECRHRGAGCLAVAGRDRRGDASVQVGAPRASAPAASGRGRCDRAAPPRPRRTAPRTSGCPTSAAASGGRRRRARGTRPGRRPPRSPPSARRGARARYGPGRPRGTRPSRPRPARRRRAAAPAPRGGRAAPAPSRRQRMTAGSKASHSRRSSTVMPVRRRLRTSPIEASTWTTSRAMVREIENSCPSPSSVSRVPGSNEPCTMRPPSSRIALWYTVDMSCSLGRAASHLPRRSGDERRTS